MKKKNSKIALQKLRIAKLSNLSVINGGNDTDDAPRSFPLHTCPVGTNGTQGGNGNGIVILNDGF